MSILDEEHYHVLEKQAQSLVKQILELRGQLSWVRAQQNALSLINRNPDEVLLEIFAHLVQPVTTNVCRTLDIVNASHVCGRWRSIAIGTPALWTEIQVYAAGQAKAFLERSRTRLFALALANDLFDEREEISQAVITHIQRLRAFCLSGVQSPSEMEWWMNTLHAPAPQLEHLALTLEEFPSGNGMMAGFPVFGNSHPALRSLRLNNVYYDPTTSPLFTNLHHLDLTLQPREIDTIQLLRILRRCPNLETLSLEDCFLSHEDATTDAGLSRGVALPRLSRLELRNVWEDDAHKLLEHLVLPTNTTFRIDVDAISEPGNLLQLPTALYQERLPALHALKSVQVVLHHTRVGEYMNQPFTLRADRDPDTDWRAPALTLSVSHGRQPSSTWISFLDLILDPDVVESFSIQFEAAAAQIVDASFTSIMWNAVLKDLDALKRLRVGGHVSARLHFNLLAALADKGERLCPRLEVLELDGAFCDRAFWRLLGGALIDRREFAERPMKQIRIAIGEGGAGGALVDEVRTLVEDLQIF